MGKRFKYRFHNSNCLFGSVKLTKNAEPDKYVYTGYSIGFDLRSEFSLFLELIWAHLCILIIREKILNLGEGLAQGLDDTTFTAEAKHPINFT